MIHLRRDFDVICEDCQRSLALDFHQQSLATAEAARRAARQVGFAERHGRTLCPVCALGLGEAEVGAWLVAHGYQRYNVILTLPDWAPQIPALQEILPDYQVGWDKGTISVLGHERMTRDLRDICTLDPLKERLRALGIAFDYHMQSGAIEFFRPGSPPMLSDGSEGEPLVLLRWMRVAAAQGGGAVTLTDFLKAYDLPQETVAAWGEAHAAEITAVIET